MIAGVLHFRDAGELSERIRVSQLRRIDMTPDPITGVGLARPHWPKHYPMTGDVTRLFMRTTKRGPGRA